jgi:hypothetical protein
MTVEFQIQDGEGTRLKAGVTIDRAIKVTSIPWRSQDIDESILTRHKFYNSYIADATGSSVLNVNGSVAPRIFSQGSATNKTIYITKFRIIFNSSNMTLSTTDSRRFGPVTAPGLTNGISMSINQDGNNNLYFLTNIKTISDFLDYNDSYVNLSGAVATNVDFLSFDFSFVDPVVLAPGSFDNVTVTINDDLSGIALFRMILKGYYEIFE